MQSDQSRRCERANGESFGDSAPEASQRLQKNMPHTLRKTVEGPLRTGMSKRNYRDERERICKRAVPLQRI
jgi:hypothetical protein